MTIDRDRRFSLFRIGILVLLVATISFILLQFWAWTAQFPWSSDTWLVFIPIVIILSGVMAIIALFARAMFKQ